MNNNRNQGQEFQKFASQHMGIGSDKLNSYSNYITPNIIEERPMNVASMDVFSRLMMDRIIFLGVPINDDVANIIQAQMLFLESTDPNSDIYLYINSPGGSVYPGFGIYDTIQYIQPSVHTICTGMAASMGAVMLCAGESGKRYCLRHSRVMIHQPLGGAQGQAADIEITANEIVKIRKEIYQIIADHTGNAIEKIEDDADRDYWMDCNEAKNYGMVDDILTRNSAPKQDEEA